MKQVFEYFDSHSLLTKKAVSYKLWREVHVGITEGLHLSPISRTSLKAKAVTINSIK
jgi:hypothetical protein